MCYCGCSPLTICSCSSPDLLKCGSKFRCIISYGICHNRSKITCNFTICIGLYAVFFYSNIISLLRFGGLDFLRFNSGNVRGNPILHSKDADRQQRDRHHQRHQE